MLNHANNHGDQAQAYQLDEALEVHCVGLPVQARNAQVHFPVVAQGVRQAVMGGATARHHWCGALPRGCECVGAREGWGEGPGDGEGDLLEDTG